MCIKLIYNHDPYIHIKRIKNEICKINARAPREEESESRHSI